MANETKPQVKPQTQSNTKPEPAKVEVKAAEPAKVDNAALLAAALKRAEERKAEAERLRKEEEADQIILQQAKDSEIAGLKAAIEAKQSELKGLQDKLATLLPVVLPTTKSGRSRSAAPAKIEGRRPELPPEGTKLYFKPKADGPIFEAEAGKGNEVIFRGQSLGAPSTAAAAIAKLAGVSTEAFDGYVAWKLSPDASKESSLKTQYLLKQAQAQAKQAS
jgi:hypothetical protein